jgi:hypothetical protein
MAGTLPDETLETGRSRLRCPVLVQVPLAGGAPRTVFSGEVVNEPSMSLIDGSSYVPVRDGPRGRLTS